MARAYLTVVVLVSLLLILFRPAGSPGLSAWRCDFAIDTSFYSTWFHNYDHGLNGWIDIVLPKYCQLCIVLWAENMFIQGNVYHESSVDATPIHQIQ